MSGKMQQNPLPEGLFKTILADPPWRFINRTGKVAPEHRRLSRYDTLRTDEICALPVQKLSAVQSHLYLWVPNALLADGLRVLSSWGFTYKSNLVWHKIRKDGGSDGRGVGFYFRNVTELVLFGVRGSFRTLGPGRRQVNLLATRKREHSRKPDELYEIIESCSPGPYLELFARYPRDGWTAWGNEAARDITPRGRQHSGYRGGPVTGPALVLPGLHQESQLGPYTQAAQARHRSPRNRALPASRRERVEAYPICLGCQDEACPMCSERIGDHDEEMLDRCAKGDS